MTLNLFSYILLALFGVSVLIAYLYTRRGQATIPQAGVFGCIINSVFLTMFFLTAQAPFVRALLSGIVIGCIFNILAVAAAYFFRQNAAVKQTP